jgi:hypothetical protein
MESYISKYQFKSIGSNLLKYIIPSEFHLRIDIDNLVLRIFRDKNLLEYDEILSKYSVDESPVAISFIKLLILSDYSLKAFKARRRINTQFAWRLIFDGLTFFKKDNPKVGVGSQGFLSIELYRYESDNNRKILRLHIWNESFANEFTGNEFGKYKVHSHLFNAQSQVLVGSLSNHRYEVLETEETSEESLYKIEWKSEKDDEGLSKRKSELNVDLKNVKLKKASSETVTIGQEYSVSINEYHSSNSNTPLTATLFLFNSDEGLNNLSKVVGPKNDPETGFKYEQINVFPSLYDIDREIKKYYNKQKLLALDWMRKIHTLEHAHRIESRHLNTFSEILSWSIVGIPAIIAGLTFYLKQMPNDKESIIVWVAILAGISTLLGTINKVIKPSSLSEKHRLNSETFEHLRHKLEKYIVFNNDDRLELVLEEIQKDWKNLTLHNVKEYNFKRASKMIKNTKAYPGNLAFLKE